MQTLKTSIVVVFILGVLFMGFNALNGPQPVTPDELAELSEVQPLEVDLGIDIPPLTPPPGVAPLEETPLQVDAQGTASASLADMPRSESTGVSRQFSDQPSSLSALPKPDPSVVGSLPAPGVSFPETAAADLSLPDPQTLTSVDATGAATDPSLTVPSLSTSNEPDSGSTSGDGNGLSNALETAKKQASEGRLKEALFTLSLFHGSPDLSATDQQRLLDMLDPLAGEVIYSQGHYLESPHKVSRGETIESIAQQYQIPWQLLANINQVQDASVLLPGTELKVVRGPFRAEVNLSRSEITVLLGDLYAGRFPMTVGTDPAPQEGTFTVLDKQPGHAYTDSTGRLIPDSNPGNPYGSIWIDLGKKVCIHGSANKGPAVSSGCIRLSPVDARDLFSILSQGSPVAIKR